MRFLVYTDLQATEGSERCFADPTLPLQRYRVRRFFQQLEQVFHQEKCDAVIDLGDTTDDRSFIPRATLDCLLSGLSRFAPNVHGIKLTGNHEQLLKFTDINSQYLFQPYFGNIDPETVSVGETGIVCHPFFEDYDEVNANIERRLELLKHAPVKVLLAHGDVRGVRYDSGEPCKKGIDPVLLAKFDLALLGHVHRHQQLGASAYYVGSPFQQDFGEANQRKYVLVVDLPDLRLKWIPVEGMPEYRVVDLETFLVLAKPTEEHRYWVTLKSIEETERFYASPLSVLGSAKLAYASQLGDAQREETAQLSGRQLLERYVATRPISGVPDEVARDLVEIGAMLMGT